MKKTDGFVRDYNSGAVVNIDNNALKAYKAKKNHQRRINNSLEEIDGLKQEISEIKQLLNVIVERLK